MTHQKNLEIAGGLWALPQHAHKVMDSELALSVAQALDTLEKETLEKAALAICPHQGMQKVVHRFCCEHAQAIRNLGGGE